MNRILLHHSELDDVRRARLSGRRAAHVREVLRAGRDTELRIGVLNGPTGKARVLHIDEQGVDIACELHAAPPPPSVDILLALPRPKVLKRLWAVLASLGVGRIVLTNAEKVERNYFDTHWIVPEHYEPLLVEGLQQSGDTRLPEVSIRRRLKPFIEDEADSLFGAAGRLLGHPRAAAPTQLPRPLQNDRCVVAVGPEGGWTPFEVELLQRHGFAPVSLGWRTLRTDVACVALLALAQALIAQYVPSERHTTTDCVT